MRWLPKGGAKPRAEGANGAPLASGMGLVTAKLRDTATHVIAMSVLMLNLCKIQCALLRLFVFLMTVFTPKENAAVVQQTLFMIF